MQYLVGITLIRVMNIWGTYIFVTQYSYKPFSLLHCYFSILAAAKSTCSFQLNLYSRDPFPVFYTPLHSRLLWFLYHGMSSPKSSPLVLTTTSSPTLGCLFLEFKKFTWLFHQHHKFISSKSIMLFFLLITATLTD